MPTRAAGARLRRCSYFQPRRARAVPVARRWLHVSEDYPWSSRTRSRWLHVSGRSVVQAARWLHVRMKKAVSCEATGHAPPA